MELTFSEKIEDFIPLNVDKELFLEKIKNLKLNGELCGALSTYIEYDKRKHEPLEIEQITHIIKSIKVNEKEIDITIKTFPTYISGFIADSVKAFKEGGIKMNILPRFYNADLNNKYFIDRNIGIIISLDIVILK